ncbi:MAG: nicotinate-nucleotide adenylyltransferase [Blastocatellales bacterium]
MSEERLRRIGIYGGTFDPIHNGHLKVAEVILNAFALDRMVFVPAFTPPHKRKQTITSPFHRMAMLALATGDWPKMFVSTIELEAPSRPYTIETLERLQTEFHPVRLFFVMGADSFREVTSWREHERILSEYDIVVAMRPGCHGSESDEESAAGRLAPQLRTRIVDLRGGAYPSSRDLANKDLESPRIYLTDYVAVDVSATRIREAVEQGRSVDDLVPPPVAAYIEKYELYRKT